MNFDLQNSELTPPKPNLSAGSSKQNTRNEESGDSKAKVSRKLKVLIVEDEALVAENMREIIQDAGYVVPDIISSGEEAVSRCSLINPDLIIMDVKLAGKTDGIHAAISIYDTFKQVPIIFLTAYSQDQFPHLSNLPSETIRFFNKPCDMDNLPKSIEEFLSGINKKR